MTKIKSCFSTLITSPNISLNPTKHIIRNYNTSLKNLTSHHNNHSSNYYSLHSLLSSVTSCLSISACKALHGAVIKTRFINDGFIGDRLVSLYLKLGHDDDARKLFDDIPGKDLVSWNSFISGFYRKGSLLSCLDVFRRMRVEAKLEPNEVTFIAMLSAFTRSNHGGGGLRDGRCFHGLVLKSGVLEEVKVGNALISMYGKMGDLGAACGLFREMSMRNLVSWNSILAVYAHGGLSNEVVVVFNGMRKEGIQPDETTLITLLQGCAETGVAKQAGLVHGYCFKCGYANDTVVLTSLMTLYAKSGLLGVAEEVFREIKGPDRVAWTAMLASYAVHGRGREAVEFFESMIKSGAQPDHVTFTHLLSACSHAGLVSEGRKYFDDMSRVYGVGRRIDHYSCIVDLLGRAGLLEDAYEVIRKMPVEPNSGIWGALLGACRIHRNVELGKTAAENLLALDSSDHRSYLLLCNIYSASGQWMDASRIRSVMKERGLIRNSGYSLIEHNNKVYRFIVGDRSHPDSHKIYAKLEEMINAVREAGLAPKTEFVLHDVEEDIKVDMINKHSEKLALAFGLLVTSSSMPITIIKNLRICGDCHSTMKLVSMIERRTIIVRDPKRFHHFTNGICSCQDYW